MPYCKGHDMLANAAFYVGLAEGLRPHLKTLLPAMPFSYVKYNFYRAAQFGLGAKLVWPRLNGHQLEEHRLLDLAVSLLPVARDGLLRIGIAEAEAAREGTEGADADAANKLVSDLQELQTAIA